MAVLVLENLGAYVLALLKAQLNAEIDYVNTLHQADDDLLVFVDPTYVPQPAEYIEIWEFDDEISILNAPLSAFPGVRVDLLQQEEDEPQKPWDTKVNQFTYQLGPTIAVGVWVKDEDRHRLAVKLARTLEAVGRVLDRTPVTLGYPSGRLVRQNSEVKPSVRASSQTMRADRTLYLQEGRISFLYRWWLSRNAESVETPSLLPQPNRFGEPIMVWNPIVADVPVQIVADQDVRMIDPYRRFVGIKFLLYAELEPPARIGDRFFVDGHHYHVQAVIQPNMEDELREYVCQDYSTWPEERVVLLRPLAYEAGDPERAISDVPVFSAEPHSAIVIKSGMQKEIDGARNVPDEDLLISFRQDEARPRPEDMILWDFETWSPDALDPPDVISGYAGLKAKVWELVSRYQPIHLGSTVIRDYKMQRRYPRL